MKIFVADGNSRGSLSVIRALGRAGHHVTVGEVTRLSYSMYSKYCSSKIVYPSPKNEPEKFYRYLLHYFEKNRFDLVIPVNDAPKEVFSKYKCEFAKYVNVPVPDYDILMSARNKFRTMELAKQLRIPYPKTVLLSGNNLFDAAAEIGYPLVLKPTESSGSRGICYVKDSTELERNYSLIKNDYSEIMVQEYIPKKPCPVDVCSIFDKEHQPAAIFMSRRLRQYPVNGGPMIYWESIRDDSVIEMGLRLLRKMKWYGPALVEFIIDARDNKPKLMEVNPRYWGALELAIQCGVNFPELHIKIASGEKFDRIFDYEIGRKARWVLPGEILYFVKSKDRFKMDPSLLNFSDKDMVYSILSREDPGPVFGVFLSVLRYLFDIKMWKYVLR